jgi:hypothetical protein
MIETKEMDVNLLEAAFYNGEQKFSYSGLNKLLSAPSVFYKEYVLKEREDESKKYLIEGTLIHYLILDHQGFDDKFLVATDALPSENNISIAEEMFELYKRKVEEDPLNENLEFSDFREEILASLLQRDLWQAVKDEDKRAAKIIEPKTEEYFKFLKKRQGRTIIDSALLEKSTRRADIVKENPQMRNLLGMDLTTDGVHLGIYNELALEMEKEEGVPFGLKGILDNMVVDVRDKKIIINDFKTTSKTLKEFSESVEKWNYWLQAIIYIKLATKFLESHIDNTWRIEFNFVVFDKYDQLYAFPVTSETLSVWLERYNEVIKHASYHYNAKDYTLPYDFIVGNVKL